MEILHQLNPERERMSDAPASPGGGGGSHDSGSPRGGGGSGGGVREQDRFLPIANISRIMKKAIPANGKIAKDAKETVQEASDKCQREKRKTINGDDLLWAMATLGFEDYIEPLKVYLQKYREMEQNRPLNSQNAADSLQKFNLKKTAVQKALDALADSGQISFKEYGKQKIYIARQDQFNIPNGEELEEMKKANNKLQEELTDQKKAISEVESEVRGLQSNLTLAEIKSKEAKLQSEVQEMEEKLNKLWNGVILVKPEDRKITEESFSEKVNLWRKRKRMFKELWDNITENSPKDQKEFKEELGLEYDEDVSVNLQSYSDMLMSLNKRRKISR